jgi:hypothetical protein
MPSAKGSINWKQPLPEILERNGWTELNSETRISLELPDVSQKGSWVVTKSQEIGFLKPVFWVSAAFEILQNCLADAARVRTPQIKTGLLISKGTESHYYLFSPLLGSKPLGLWEIIKQAEENRTSPEHHRLQRIADGIRASCMPLCELTANHDFHGGNVVLPDFKLPEDEITTCENFLSLFYVIDLERSSLCGDPERTITKDYSGCKSRAHLKIQIIHQAMHEICSLPDSVFENAVETMIAQVPETLLISPDEKYPRHYYPYPPRVLKNLLCRRDNMPETLSHDNLLKIAYD